jgi:hypothetical protein
MSRPAIRDGFQTKSIISQNPFSGHFLLSGKYSAPPGFLTNTDRNLYSRLKAPPCRVLFHQPSSRLVAMHKALPQNLTRAGEKIPLQFGASRL